MIACHPVPVKNRPIQIVSREDGSGTRDGFVEYITNKEKKTMQLSKDAIIADSTAAMLSNVRSNPGAIGYDSEGYVTDDVKILHLDGIDIEDTQNYPLKRNLTVVYKESIDTTPNRIDSKAIYDTNQAAKKFLQYITSSDVKEQIQKGYVALDNSTPYVVAPNLFGTVTISGSTSLEPLMQELKAMYKKVQPNVQVDITAGGSGVGRDDVRDNKVDFGMISATLSDSQKENIQNGDTTIQVKTMDIALDKIAIIVNKLNPYNNITASKLWDIFDIEKTGYKTWGDMNLEET